MSFVRVAALKRQQMLLIVTRTSTTTCMFRGLATYLGGGRPNNNNNAASRPQTPGSTGMPTQQQQQRQQQQQPPNARPNFGRPPNNPTTQATTTQQPDTKNNFILEVTDTTMQVFEQVWLNQPVPLILDFWAPWCGPCRMLTPTLENVVKSYGGKVRLAKINTDVHSQMAQQMNVTQLPTVWGLFNKKLVDRFVGAHPEERVKEMVTKLLAVAGAIPGEPPLDVVNGVDDALALLKQPMSFSAEEMKEIQDVLKHAATMVMDKNSDPRAKAKFESLHAKAFAGLLRCALLDKQYAAAQEVAKEIMKRFPKSDEPEVKSALAALNLTVEPTPPQQQQHHHHHQHQQPINTSSQSPPPPSNSNRVAAATDVLRRSVEENPTNSKARYDLAKHLFSEGHHTEAIDEALILLKRDRGFNDGAARLLLIEIFNALGNTGDVVKEGRKRMSSILMN